MSAVPSAVNSAAETAYKSARYRQADTAHHLPSQQMASSADHGQLVVSSNLEKRFAKKSEFPHEESD